MDPLKKLAQIAGISTDNNILGTGFHVVKGSKGESAAIIKHGNFSLAFVQEGLGTKNLVADAMAKISGKTYYQNIAQDTVAAIINDLITVGARPIGVLAYWAAGSQKWFGNTKRMKALVTGWKEACDMSGVAWIGGETPTLQGIINPETIDLGGSAFGTITSEATIRLGEDLQAGDAIIVLESSGIHTNGLSLARKLTKSLASGYATKLPSGRLYGEALLDPTIIYAKVVEDLLAANIGIHYMVHITGHGWRKLMRHQKQFTYRIHTIPPVPEVLQFIVRKAQLDATEAYGNLNMGAGYALYISEKDVEKVITIVKRHKIKAFHVGTIEKGEKQVLIEPQHIVFPGKSLQVRA